MATAASSSWTGELGLSIGLNWEHDKGLLQDSGSHPGPVRGRVSVGQGKDRHLSQDLHLEPELEKPQELTLELSCPSGTSLGPRPL